MNNGAVKPMVVASAIGKYVSPKNNDVIDAAKNAGKHSGKSDGIDKTVRKKKRPYGWR